eukprot:COSAG04_NODE_1038_length_8607_cov_2.977433_7_plen_155_part_00
MPAVCTGDLLERLRGWSDELLDEVHVSAPWSVSRLRGLCLIAWLLSFSWHRRSVRAQGDVQFVQTPRAAEGLLPNVGRRGAGSSRQAVPNHSQHPLIEELLDLEPAKQACAEIGFENLRSDNETIILLSKYENAPPLYWHQVSGAPLSLRPLPS